MSEAPSTSRLLLADTAWFGIVALIALTAGIVGDRIFRHPPLGLRYQTAVERALSSPPASGEIPHGPVNIVSLEEVQELLLRPDVIALDARPRIFYDLGHLPGARSLSREQFETDYAGLASTLRIPGKTLLIYCSDASCEDSAIVARLLQQRGFQSLLLFPGGFAEWEAAGQPVEADQ